MLILPLIQEYSGPSNSRPVELKEKNIKNNYIYVLKDNKILKLFITINKEILKNSMSNIMNLLDDYMFEIVDEEEMENCCFPIKMEFIGKFKLNKKRKTNNYKIPSTDLTDSSLIYVLNYIYNKPSLDSEDLFNLEYEKYDKTSESFKSIVEDVISNLNIEIIEEYDYNKFVESVEYIRFVTNKENLWNKINLKHLKEILNSLESNTNALKALGIDINLEKQKQKVK